MLYKKIIFTTLLLLMFGSINADEKSHRQAAAKLLEATHAANTITAYIQQLEQSFSAMPMNPEMNQQQRNIAKTYQNNILSLIKQSISWEKMKPDFITLYARAYSEEDLTELARFYQSRLGQSMLEKTPFVMQQSMQITQASMQKIMPQIQTKTQEMMMDLRKTEN